MTPLFLVPVAFVTAMSAPQSDPVKLPLPADVGSAATLGLGIQRTMTLLATSTARHRNTVRILFYGQSITEQPWWKMVADDIRRRFPNANLIIENRALGGFASQLLYRTAETDLYSFYPDLMIFHVYGAHNNYEDIIAGARSRTTAEVLIQTDHVTNDADLQEETDPARLSPNGKIWNSFMNYLWLPTMSRRYGAGLEYQRDLWKEYLRQTGFHAAQFLQDQVHPNQQGDWLMAQFANAYLVKRADSHIDPMNCDTVRTYRVGRDVRWTGGRLTLPFDGNRVDVVLKAAGNQITTLHERRSDNRAAQSVASPPVGAVRIDGRPPSQIPELYTFTRALATPGGKWPVILKLGWQQPLQVEQWQMEVTRDASNTKLYRFQLTGSRTGPDGEGRSDQKFVSRSGRVVIDPADWNVEYSLALAGISSPPDRFTVRWSVAPLFQNNVLDTPSPGAGIENVQTVAQGLQPGRHVLEIDCARAGRIAAIRIYRPPVSADANIRGAAERRREDAKG